MTPYTILELPLKNLFIPAYHAFVKNKFKEYRPAVSFSFISGSFTVKTAQNFSDLKEVFELRNTVFFNEKKLRGNVLGYDFDKFDADSDHLMIIDNASGLLAGTYRLRSSLYCGSFYSNQEFVNKKILSFNGPLLELGRACVHKDWRNGAVIMLLWKGIAAYMKKTGTQRLFGCSSVYAEPENTARLSDFTDLAAALLTRCTPQTGYLTLPRNLYRHFTAEKIIRKKIKILKEGHISAEQQMDTLPPLLESYLKLGACICGMPAWDKQFRCFDFMTILDTVKIPCAVRKRFGID